MVFDTKRSNVKLATKSRQRIVLPLISDVTKDAVEMMAECACGEGVEWLVTCPAAEDDRAQRNLVRVKSVVQQLVPVCRYLYLCISFQFWNHVHHMRNTQLTVPNALWISRKEKGCDAADTEQLH